MFEYAKLIGTPPEGIALETRRKHAIKNQQAPDPDYQSQRVDQLRKDQHPAWELRKNCTGLYNCYGQVWASRRTAIYDADQLEIIRNDDGYTELRDDERPERGDLAVYRATNGGRSIMHVGLVVELRQLSVGGIILDPTPWILSKWNDASSEVVHHFNDVPWDTGSFTLSYWTDRK